MITFKVIAIPIRHVSRNVVKRITTRWTCNIANANALMVAASNAKYIANDQTTGSSLTNRISQ